MRRTLNEEIETGRNVSSKVKKPKHSPHPPQRAAAKATPGAAAKRWLILATVGLMTGGVVWAIFEFVVWNTIPSDMVGKWVLFDGTHEANIQFYRGGTMVGTFNQGGNPFVVESRVVVEGKKIFSTTLNKQTQQYETKVLTIRSLEPHRLVIEDFQGKVMELERAE